MAAAEPLAKASFTGAVIVTWQEPSTNSEAEFDIYRVLSTDTFTGATPIGRVPTDINTYTDSTALPGTSYQYRVNALNLGGDVPSSVSGITTAQGPLPKPTGLTLISSNIGIGKATLNGLMIGAAVPRPRPSVTLCIAKRPRRATSDFPRPQQQR